MDTVSPPETLRVVVNFLRRRVAARHSLPAQTHGAAAALMVGTNDKRNDFRCASLLHASRCPLFKRCRAVEQPAEAGLPAISEPNSSGKDCEYTPRKDVTFFSPLTPAFSLGKWNILCRRANDRYRPFVAGLGIVFRAKWRREYIENGNLVKTKMETVPFSQSFKDDRMTTWRLLRYSIQSSEHSRGTQWYLESRLTAIIHHRRRFFSCLKSGFYACMSRAGTPVVECLSAHAASEAHRISASSEQPGPVIGAAGQRTQSVRLQMLGHGSEGNRRRIELGVCALGGYIFGHFGVSEQRSHGGNMAGTNAKLGGLLSGRDRRSSRTERLIGINMRCLDGEGGQNTLLDGDTRRTVF